MDKVEEDAPGDDRIETVEPMYSELRRRQPYSQLPTNVSDLQFYAARGRREKPRARWPHPKDVVRGWWVALLGRGAALAERVLPEWFTHVSVEANTTRWGGTQWVVDTWRALRWPLAATAAILCVLVMSWWMLAPALILNLGFTSETLFKGRADPASAPPFGASDSPGNHRVDAKGTPIDNPLPLCDLLYDRREHAVHRDELAAALSRRIAAAITSSPEREEDDGVRLFKTNVPDHRQGPRWNLFVENDAVRPELPRVIEPLPIALNKLSEQYLEAILNRESPHAMGISITRAKKLFHASTVAWLERECARHPLAMGAPIPQSDAFAAQVAETGAFTVNTTDYIAPVVREPEPHSNHHHDGHEREAPAPSWTREEDSLISETIDIYRADDEEEEEEQQQRREVPQPSPPSQQQQKQLLLAPPAPKSEPPLDAAAYLRNVSAFELHALLYHLAAQAQDVWITKRSHVDAAIQIGAEAVDRLVGNEDGADAGKGDAMRLMARQQTATMDEKLDPLMAEFRYRALWSGETGCVCPHHVGVPIPGAAWTEVARRSKKTLVLFYPSLPEWVHHPRQDASEDQPLLSAALMGWFGAESGAAADRRSLAVARGDPVLRPLKTNGGPIGVPYDAESPWAWVEGLDFRGQRQRLRVSPTSLSCILSCTRTCSEKIINAVP